MKKITRTVYMTKEAIDLIEKDINAQSSYTVFSNKEEGTMELDLTLDVLETFQLTEDVLENIIDGLLPALSEKELALKKDQVKVTLRSMGLSV
jgi:hypothetical protein